MTAPFRVELLDSSHDRSGFTCGVEPLDRYLKLQASQDVKNHVSVCYVVIETSSGVIAGYYTLSASNVQLSELPAKLSKKLPKYPTVPVARVGRLAVGSAYQGQQLGAALLADAGDRALHAPMGIYALLFDAKDEKAAAFYQHLGFLEIGGPRTLILPLATLRKARDNLTTPE